MWGENNSNSGENCSEKPIVLYIAGTGHSGSTVLSFILNTHPEIFAIGEMHAPPFPADRPSERVCSCGETVLNCPFFSSMEERLEKLGYRFDPTSWDLTYRFNLHPVVNRLLVGSLRNSLLEKLRDWVVRRHPAYRRRIEAIDTMNEVFVLTSLQLTGTTVFVDATKDHMRIRHLKRIFGDQLKVIHLVRDPRGYVVSAMKQPGGVSLKTAMKFWRRTNQNVKRQLKLLNDDQKIVIRYEELCRYPAETLAKIGVFTGVGPISVPMDFRQTAHHIMGNRMRRSTSPGKLRLDDKWRNVLSSGSLQRISERLGAISQDYGFDLSSPELF